METLLAIKRFWPLGVFFLGIAAGCTFTNWRWEAKERDRLQEQIESQAAAAEDALKRSQAVEDQLAKLRRNNRDINRRLANEIAKAAYACRLPDDGLRLLQAAVDGSAPSEPDPALR